MDDAERMQRWIDAVRGELDIPPNLTLDVPAVLDLARVAAHGVLRPAAPLTTFLAGLAAGRSGGSDDDIARAIARVVAIAPEAVVRDAPAQRPRE
ncbi:MAG: hypothetical protein JWM50_960 [Microbacteriaceae bacterium]|jgi:hypothetical protein|nr:hypothetical protein [Microbacteriaceae bacterium]